jgi:hypothetical protein
LQTSLFFDIGLRPNPDKHDVGASTCECPRAAQGYSA